MIFISIGVLIVNILILITMPGWKTLDNIETTLDRIEERLNEQSGYIDAEFTDID